MFIFFCYIFQFSNGNSSDLTQSQSSGCGDQQGDENVEPSVKRRKIRSGINNDGDSNKLLGRELVVYDKQSRCLLTEGEYELVLSEVYDSQELHCGNSPKKNASWENVNMNKSDKVLFKLLLYQSYSNISSRKK